MNEKKLSKAIAKSIMSIPPASITVRGREASWLADAVIMGIMGGKSAEHEAASALMDKCLRKHMPNVRDAAIEFCNELSSNGAHVPAFAVPFLSHIMQHHLDSANRDIADKPALED